MYSKFQANSLLTINSLYLPFRKFFHSSLYLPFRKFFIECFLIAVRQENTLDKLVVVHELEFAMKRAL